MFEPGRWKSIPVIREFAMTHTRGKIGEESGISLCFDPWLGEEKLVDVLGKWPVNSVNRNKTSTRKLQSE